jgi:hypothetical protein
VAFEKTFIFEPTDLVRLLTHYTEGVVPLDSEVTNVGINPFLDRFIGIEVKSQEWEGFEPLQIRYEGKRILGWSKGEGDPQWTEANETPKRQ